MSMNNKPLESADQKTVDAVKQLTSVLTQKPDDLCAIKEEMIKLFEYLSSEEGRTNSNCMAVDEYFIVNDFWADIDLPDEFHDIISDAAGVLRDAVSAPEVTADLESTPEQLLERTKQL